MARDKSNGMYYRSHREGKQVVREYFGDGDAARLAAALDADKRRRKQEETAAVKLLRRRWDEACRPLEPLRDGTKLLLRAVRLVARRRRGQDGDPAMDNGKCDVIKELRELVALGEAGDKSVLPRVQRLLDQHPEITSHFGDAAKVATELWLEIYIGKDVFMTETTRRQMESLRLWIADPVPPPLEALMVEQILVHWIQLYATSALHAQAMMKKASPAILRERQRQVEASQRLYDVSIKQLAELRKLTATPPVDRLAMLFPVVARDDQESVEEGPTQAPADAAADICP